MHHIHLVVPGLNRKLHIHEVSSREKNESIVQSQALLDIHWLNSMLMEALLYTEYFKYDRKDSTSCLTH